MRKTVEFKEGIVRKNDGAEVFTPHVDEVLNSAQKPQEGKEIRVKVNAESREGMKKRALAGIEVPGFSTFSMWCDEGLSMGGDDSAPAPLAYFAAAIAF